MAWTIIFHHHVQDDLDYLGSSVASRLLKVIDEKIQNGEPDKLGKLLRGKLAGCRSIRVGDTRIVYKVDNRSIEVIIISIGARKDKEVYETAEKRL